MGSMPSMNFAAGAGKKMFGPIFSFKLRETFFSTKCCPQTMDAEFECQTGSLARAPNIALYFSYDSIRCGDRSRVTHVEFQ